MTTAAAPRPHTVRVVAACSNCSLDVTQTEPQFPWYHLETGKEEC